MNLTEREMEIIKDKMCCDIIEDYEYDYNKTTTAVQVVTKDMTIQELADLLQDALNSEYKDIEEKHIELAYVLSVLIGKVARSTEDSMRPGVIVIY